MKKLMIAFAAVAVAAVSQAATFNWTSSTVGYALDAAGVVNNGDYTASTTTRMRSNGTWNYALTIFAAGTETVLGSTSGALSAASPNGKVAFSAVTIDSVGNDVAIDYKIILSGTQTALNNRGKEASGYDYTDAALTSVALTGSTTTDALGGATVLTAAAPASWTVSGITYESPEPTPEPTSAMLMLLGVAGLALRRKQK